MITIGIDPGIERIGVGIVEKKKGYHLLFHDLITTSSKDETAKRLSLLFTALTEILTRFSLDFAAVEKLFFAKNVKTAMRVAEARGVILLALENQGIPIFEYTPLEVKQALVGYGRAPKAQMMKIVSRILNLSEPIIQDDVADSVALAITHLNTLRFRTKLEKSIDDFKKGSGNS